MPSPPSPLRLPQELLDLVIDNIAATAPLSKTNRDALYACQSLSRSCCHRANKHIFHCFRIDDKRDRAVRHLENLHDAMMQPLTGRVSSFYTYIKEVHIHLENGYGRFGRILRPIVDELIGKQGGIASFKFICSPRGWFQTDEQLRQAVLLVIRSPHLRSLTLHGMKDVPDNILSDTHITYLELSDCSPPSQLLRNILRCALPTERGSRLPDLDSLKADYLFLEDYPDTTGTPAESPSGDIFLDRPYIFSRIRRCSLSMSAYSFHRLAQLFPQSAILESLDLIYPPGFHFPMCPRSFLDLSHLKRLSRLSLYHTGYWTHHSIVLQEPQQTCEDFSEFFSKTKTPPSLKVIDLAIVVSFGALKRRPRNCSMEQTFFHSLDGDASHKWNRLDLLLSTIDSVSDLVINIYFDDKLVEEIGDKRSVVRKTNALIQRAFLSSSKTKTLSINVGFSPYREEDHIYKGFSTREVWDAMDFDV